MVSKTFYEMIIKREDKMLIKEIRDFNKDVPEKKIILDQMGPSDVAELALQIAAFAALDSKRGHDDEDFGDGTSAVEQFLDNLGDKISDMRNMNKMKKALADAEKGKV